MKLFRKKSKKKSRTISDNSSKMQKRCLNCGAELQGGYCHVCGQENRKLSMREIFEEFVDILVIFDRSFLKTLKKLLFRPGELSLAFLAGERTKYIRPMKIYLIFSFIFFIVSFTNFSLNEGNIQVSLSDTAENQTELSQAEEIENLKNEIDDIPEMFSSKTDKIIKNKLTNLLNNPQLFFENFKELLPKMIFLLLPLYALILKLHYSRRKIAYINHFVYTLNLHSVGFFLLIINKLTSAIFPDSIAQFFSLLIICFPIWQYISMKKIYNQSGAKTFFMMFSQSFSYGIILIIAVLVTLILSIVFM